MRERDPPMGAAPHEVPVSDAGGSDDVTHTADEGASASADALSWARPGVLVDRFVLLKPIGEGGMGSVWAAYDGELDRKVAIKLIRPERAFDEDVRARMTREAQALARLSHPNVVTVYEVGVHRLQLYLAMEYVEGETLKAWLAREPSTRARLERALEIVRQAGSGLAAAHDAGLVHRDFKPANVIVGADGRVRVVDFGLARVHGEADPPARDALVSTFRDEALRSSSGDGMRTSDPGLATRAVLEANVTEAGIFIGTPRYMAPEQFDGKPMGARVDQFALCTVLFECAFGKPPWTGTTAAAIHAEMMDGPPTLPEDDQVPAWVRAVIRRGLAPRASQRFASMHELLEALLAPEQRPATRSSRAPWIAMSIALVLALVAFAWLALRPEPSRAPSCEHIAGRIAEVWNASKRAELEAAFRATELPYAETAITGTAAALDEYAREWSAAATSACLLATEDEWSGHAAARARSSCLDLRLAEIAHIVELLVHADAATVESALDATGALTPISSCDDAERSVFAQDDDALSLRLQLAEAKTLGRLGRTEDAVERATAVADEAGRRGATGLRAQALLARSGIVLGRASSRHDAEDAFWLALGANDDETAMLAAITAVEQSRDEADRHEWRVRAGALIERRREGPRAHARLAAALGIAADRQGFPGLAVEYLRAATETLRAETDREPLLLVRCWSALAQSLARSDSAVAGENAFSIALELARTRFGASHPITARLESAAGVELASHQRYDDALPHLRRAVEIFDAVPGPPSVDAINASRALGEALAFAGEPRAALQILLRADDARPAPASKAAALLDRAIGTALIFDGRPRDAIPLLRRGLLREQALWGEEHSDLSIGLNRLATALEAIGDIAGSIRVTRRAVELLTRSGEMAASALQLANLAVLTGKLGEHAVAVTYARRAIDMRLAVRPADAQLCFPLRLLGLELIALSRPRDAIVPLERALALHSSAQFDAHERPKTQLALARALWDSATDRDRARQLATDARAALLVDDPDSVELTETEAWLRAHPG